MFKRVAHTLCLVLICILPTAARAQTEAAGPSQSDEQVFTQKEVTRKAVIISAPQPGTTRESRQTNTEGKVKLRAVLSSAGEVKDIAVLQGLPHGLTENCVEAARKIKFTPAQKDGRPVSQYVTLEYPFVIYIYEQVLKQKAKILSMPAPQYTEEARRDRITGQVILEVGLISWGEVEVIRVVKEQPGGLTEKAVEAAERIKFEPAKIGDRPVSQRKLLTFNFSLR